MSPRPGAKALMEVETEKASGLRGPLRWVVLGCLLSLLIGLTIFGLVSGRDTGDPAPAPGEEPFPESPGFSTPQ